MNNNFSTENDQSNLQTTLTPSILEDHYSYQEQMLYDPKFDVAESSSPWGSNITGDLSDSKANLNNNQANFKITGENYTYSVLANPPDNSWTKTLNPDFPSYPDTATINQNGCFVYHDWTEGADQSPSVHWEKNFTMPRNMSDYSITSANLSAIINATVKALGNSSSNGNHGIEVPGDVVQGGTQYATYDYVRFYILISDPNATKKYEVAYYQTLDLGKDSAGIYDYLSDTYLITVPEDVLIFYLTSVLEMDHFNFTVTLGIRIWCEDNWNVDRDEFTELYIKYLNLTFTYAKKVNQLNTISWQQTGEMINKTYYENLYPESTISIQIDNATLNLRYRIDQPWPTSSLNSHIKFFINDYELLQTLSLLDANSTWQGINSGQGIDVSSLININVNITFKMQLYIADEFIFGNNITFSIDNVTLDVGYTVIVQTPEIDANLEIAGSYETNIIWNNSFTIDFNYTELSTGIGIQNAIINIIWIDDFTITEISNDTGIYRFVGQTSNTTSGESYTLKVVASKRGYISKSLQLKITIIGRNTNVEIFINSVKTSVSTVTIMDPLLIEAKYYDTDLLKQLENATVSLVGSGITPQYYQYSEINGTYTYLVNTTKLGLGTHLISFYAEKENFQQAYQQIEIRIIEREAYMEAYFNGTKWDAGVRYDISILNIINITTTYKDLNTNATINIDNLTLVGLEPSAFVSNRIGNSYEFIINTESLGLGTHFGSIIPAVDNYELNPYNFQILVKQIETIIFTKDQNQSYTLTPGSNFKLDLIIQTLEGSKNISNCEVYYSWKFGQGNLIENNTISGLYSTTFENLAEGTYKIYITVNKGPYYKFEQFELTLIVAYPPGTTIGIPPEVLYLIGLGFLAFFGLFIMYIRVWRFPKQVRKVRKASKLLPKNKSLEKIGIANIKQTYGSEWINKTTNLLNKIGIKPTITATVTPKAPIAQTTTTPPITEREIEAEKLIPAPEPIKTETPQKTIEEIKEKESKKSKKIKKSKELEKPKPEDIIDTNKTKATPENVETVEQKINKIEEKPKKIEKKDLPKVKSLPKKSDKSTKDENKNNNDKN
ncbi:MAG: hypothetical protein ACTSO2_04670 [Promethearchaeota archaeon]